MGPTPRREGPPAPFDAMSMNSERTLVHRTGGPSVAPIDPLSVLSDRTLPS